MANFWYRRIAVQHKAVLSDVPSLWHDQVAEMLEDAGLDESGYPV